MALLASLGWIHGLLPLSISQVCLCRRQESGRASANSDPLPPATVDVTPMLQLVRVLGEGNRAHRWRSTAPALSVSRELWGGYDISWRAVMVCVASEKKRVDLRCRAMCPFELADRSVLPLIYWLRVGYTVVYPRFAHDFKSRPDACYAGPCVLSRR